MLGWSARSLIAQRCPFANKNSITPFLALSTKTHSGPQNQNPAATVRFRNSKSVLIYIIGEHRDFHWVIDCFSKRLDYDFIEFDLKTHERDKSIENIKIESITDNLDDYTKEKIKESTSNIFGQRSIELNENLSKYLNFQSPDANESTKTDLFEEYFYPEYFLIFFGFYSVELS